MYIAEMSTIKIRVSVYVSDQTTDIDSSFFSDQSTDIYILDFCDKTTYIYIYIVKASVIKPQISIV
jgi:hypothetical protein